MATVVTSAGVSKLDPVDACDIFERIISDFKGLYPKSQNIREDLECFLELLTGEVQKLSVERDSVEIQLSEIEKNLDIGDGSDRPFKDHLQDIIEATKDGGKIVVEAAEVARDCYDLVDRIILPSPDISLRRKIEALAKELRSFDPTESKGLYGHCETRTACA
jgi:hypothetical protein